MHIFDEDKIVSEIIIGGLKRNFRELGIERTEDIINGPTYSESTRKKLLFYYDELIGRD